MTPGVHQEAVYRAEMIALTPVAKEFDGDRDEILRKLEENRETIRGFGVRRLGMLGSYARGEQTETSHMDFLVEFESPTFHDYFDLKLFLEALFDCKVDLAFHDTIKPRIGNTILEETVYADGLWALDG